MSPLNPPHRNRISLLTGSPSAYRIAHVWITNLCILGLQVRVLDCANLFDPFLVAHEGGHHLEPEFLLESIQIQKADTPLEFLGAARSILQDRGSGFFVILAPLRHFVDSAASVTGRNLLLESFLATLRGINKKSRPVLLVEASGEPLAKKALGEMTRIASHVWEAKGDEESGPRDAGRFSRDRFSRPALAG